MTDQPDEPSELSLAAQRKREAREDQTESLEGTLENGVQEPSKRIGSWGFRLGTLLGVYMVYNLFVLGYGDHEHDPQEVFSSYRNLTEQFETDRTGFPDVVQRPQ